jgi:catechol 2,3-dioxygenase-like lactoylglutathione lyase family enzyme
VYGTATNRCLPTDAIEPIIVKGGKDGTMEKKLAAVGLFVEDIKKMVEFYRDVIGFKTDWTEGPYAGFEQDNINFMMYERKLLPEYLGKAVSYPKGLNGSFEIYIDLPFFEDVDREFERVVKLGAKPIVNPRTEPWKMRTSYVADPEGNLIEIGSWGKGKTNL